MRTHCLASHPCLGSWGHRLVGSARQGYPHPLVVRTGIEQNPPGTSPVVSPTSNSVAALENHEASSPLAMNRVLQHKLKNQREPRLGWRANERVGHRGCLPMPRCHILMMTPTVALALGDSPAVCDYSHQTHGQVMQVSDNRWDSPLVKNTMGVVVSQGQRH